jgi:3-oxo-5-alpha-steroid 4-dehydrogenase 3 / polyprenol reductase
MPWYGRIVSLFFLAQFGFYTIRQNECHHYLSTLPSGPDYQLPSKGEFKNTVCPHYGDEIAIYYAISVIGANWTRIFSLNWTITLGYYFVIVNLQTTASRTKHWYIKRYGKEKVEHKALTIWIKGLF